MKFYFILAFAALLATAPMAGAQPAPQMQAPGHGLAAPVKSDTTISAGTLAGEVLTWVAAVFGVPIGTLITAWLYRAFTLAGVAMSDAMRARLQEIIINGINLGAKKAAAEASGKGEIEIRNAAIAHTIAYVQTHAAGELRALGIDPDSNLATEAITARIMTAIADINTPTPKVLAAAT